MSPRQPANRRFRTVEEVSAGGLVVDRRDRHSRAALIARHDRKGRLIWSLPKGHVEPGESFEQAAIREVEEETGIQGTLLGALGSISFWFVADDRRVHKTVHHYLLEAQTHTLSDADVEVVEVDWVDLREVAGRLAYADERRLVDRAAEMLDSA